MHNYLNTVGKLFTKVGMDTYHEVASTALHEFTCLLHRQSASFGKMRLLQITVINLSLIDLATKSSHQPQQQPQHRSQTLESAIQLAIDMFIIVLRRLNSLRTRPETSIRRALMPSVKIFIDWLLCNSQLWRPLPDQLPPHLGPTPRRLRSIAVALNIASRLRTAAEFSRQVCGRVKLEEDLEMAGFVPLLSLPREEDGRQEDESGVEEVLLAMDEEEIERVKDQKRLEKVCLFGEYLCGLEEALMRFEVASGRYREVKRSVAGGEAVAGGGRGGCSEEEVEEIGEMLSEELCLDEELVQLKG